MENQRMEIIGRRVAGELEDVLDNFIFFEKKVIKIKCIVII